MTVPIKKTVYICSLSDELHGGILGTCVLYFDIYCIENARLLELTYA